MNEIKRAVGEWCANHHYIVQLSAIAGMGFTTIQTQVEGLLRLFLLVCQIAVALGTLGLTAAAIRGRKRPGPRPPEAKPSGLKRWRRRGKDTYETDDDVRDG